MEIRECVIHSACRSGFFFVFGVVGPSGNSQYVLGTFTSCTSCVLSMLAPGLSMLIMYALFTFLLTWPHPLHVSHVICYLSASDCVFCIQMLLLNMTWALSHPLKLQSIHKNVWHDTKLNTLNWIREIIIGLLYYKIDDGRNSIPISPHSLICFFHSRLLECSFSSERGLWILSLIFYSVKELWYDRCKQTLQGFIHTWFAFLEGIFWGNACPCRVRECKGRKEKGHKLNPEAKKQMFLRYLYPLHLTHELSVGLQESIKRAWRFSLSCAHRHILIILLYCFPPHLLTLNHERTTSGLSSALAYTLSHQMRPSTLQLRSILHLKKIFWTQRRFITSADRVSW